MEVHFRNGSGPYLAEIIQIWDCGLTGITRSPVVYKKNLVITNRHVFFQPTELVRFLGLSAKFKRGNSSYVDTSLPQKHFFVPIKRSQDRRHKKRQLVGKLLLMDKFTTHSIRSTVGVSQNFITVVRRQLKTQKGR